MLLLLTSYFSYAQPAQVASAISSNSTKNQAEQGRRGLRWGFGYSIGNSSHADSYFIDQFGSNREYPGLRLYNFDARLGWEFHKRIGIYGIWKFSPSNATVSPYRSRYYGGYLTCYLTDDPRFYLLGGMGKYDSKISREETSGEGVLLNFGAGVELREHILFEINVLTGAMDPGNVTPDPFVDREFSFLVGVAYVY